MSVLLLFNILVGKKNFGTAIEIKGEEIYQEDDDYDEEFDETEELDEEDFKIVK